MAKLKKKVTAIVLCVVLVLCGGLACLVVLLNGRNNEPSAAVVFNTNIGLTFNSDFQSASVTQNHWLAGDESKTADLAQTNLGEAMSTSLVPKLTDQARYVVLEFVFENTSSTIPFSLTVAYSDTGATDSNFSVKYLSSDTELWVGAESEKTFLNDSFSDLEVYVNSVVYAYVLIEITDVTTSAELSGYFTWTLSLTNDGGSVSTSLEVKQDDDGYYVEMGYFPQTYITDTTGLTLVSSQEDYAVNTYVEVSGKYYQCELIKWDVLGIYTAGATTEQTETKELTEYTGQTTLEDGQQLVLQSRYGLKYVAWDSDYKDSSTVYNGSDIDTWLETFYTNILATNYSSNIVTRTIDYNTTANHTGLEDGYENYIGRNVWLLSYDEASTWYGKDDADARIMYATAYCLESDSESTDYWWLRSSFLVNNTYVCAGDFNPGGYDSSYSVNNAALCVRPAMLITL